MKLVNSTLLGAFDAFVQNIKPSDKIAIYHDSDPDGTCSAVIVGKAIECLRGKKIDSHIGRKKGEYCFTVALAKELRLLGINKIISLDIATDEEPSGILSAAEFANVLIFDHHKLYNDFNKSAKNIVLLKPQLLYEDIDPQLYCTSKFVFDMMSRHARLDALDWIAGVGIVADVASKMWPDFLKCVFRKYNIELRKDFFKSRLGTIAHTISGAEVYNERNVSLCYNILYNANRPNDVLKSVLVKYARIISKEINHFVKNVRKLAEFYDDVGLVFYFYKPKYSINSPLSTVLGFKYPEKTLITVTTSKIVARVSARRQDKKIAVNDLLEGAIIGFKNATAGGHKVASGATFPARYLPLFKTRIIARLTEISSEG